MPDRREDTMLLALKREKEAQLRNIGSFRMMENARKWILSQSLQKEYRSIDTSILAQWDWFHMYDLYNCKIINSCYFKLLSLW